MGTGGWKSDGGGSAVSVRWKEGEWFCREPGGVLFMPFIGDLVTGWYY